MQDEQEAAQEASQEVVSTEQVEAEVAEAGDEAEAPESTTGTPEEAPADGDKPEDKKTSRSERRRAKIAESEKRVADLNHELEQRSKQLERMNEAAQKLPAPKETDFNSYDEYQAALVAHHSLRTMDARAASDLQEQLAAKRAEVTDAAHARKRELASSWQDQVIEAKGRYTDFDKVFTNDLPISDIAAEILSGSDVGADVAYYLGTHRAEAIEIAKLNPLEQARRIGAIEARVSLPKPKTISNAPDPINPVKGNATAQTDPANMSVDQYRAWRAGGGKF